MTRPRLAPKGEQVPAEPPTRAKLVDQLEKLTARLRIDEDYQQRGAEELARLRQRMSELRRRIEGRRPD